MKHLKNPWVAFVLGIAAGIGTLEVVARTMGKGSPPSQIVTGA